MDTYIINFPFKKKDANLILIINFKNTGIITQVKGDYSAGRFKTYSRVKLSYWKIESNSLGMYFTDV